MCGLDFNNSSFKQLLYGVIHKPRGPVRGEGGFPNCPCQSTRGEGGQGDGPCGLFSALKSLFSKNDLEKNNNLHLNYQKKMMKKDFS